MADSRKLTFDFLLKDKLSPGLEKIGKHSEKLHGTLGKLGSAGMGGLTKAAGLATAGLAALGLSAAGVGAAISKGLDAQAATAKLRAQLDLTAVESKKIGTTAGKLYSQAYGESMDQVRTSIASVISNMDGMRKASEADLQATTARAMDLATVMDEDVGAVTRAVSQMMRTGLAKNSKEAFDVLTRGAQLGANKSQDLLDTFNEYGTQFRKLGLSGKAAMGLITQGLKGGARDADLAADALKEFSIRSIDGSKGTAAGFKALGLDAGTMAAKIGKGGKSAASALDLTLDRLRGIKDPVKQSAAATALFGTQAEDLGKALFSMDPSKAVGALGKVGGAADKAGKQIGDNLKSKFESFKRTIETNVTNFVTNKVLPVMSKLGDQMGKGFKSGDAGKNASLFEKLGAAMRKVGDWAKKTLIPALKDLGHWIQDKVMPAASKFYGSVLKGLGDAFHTVKKAIDENHKPLVSLGNFLKKVADVVTKYVVPAIGWFYGHVIKNWGTALSLVIKIIANSWKVVSFLGKTVGNVGAAIVKTFLWMAGSVIHAAAKAFGWMPGIGPKLKAADKEFSKFASSVNAKIASIKGAKAVKITVSAAGKWQIPGGGKAATTAGLAKGGPVPSVGPQSSRAYDSVPAMLRVDEHVITPEEVDGAGGHGAVYRMRRLMKAGKLKGFASGGAVGVNPSLSAPSVASMQSTVWNPINSGVGAMVTKLANALAKMGGGSASGVVAAARRMIGLPYSWGGGGSNGPSYGIGRGAGTYGFDCSGLAEYAWWQGARKRIGGVTNSQWASSHPISGPRPGALSFPGGPGVHVMIGSDRPGYVIQAPFTGSHVQEVPRTGSNWRWPNAAGYATGGAVKRKRKHTFKAALGHYAHSPKSATFTFKPIHYGWTPAGEAADAWHQVGGGAWVRQREQASAGPWGGTGARIRAKAKALKADVMVTKGHGGHPPGTYMAAVADVKYGGIGELYTRGMLRAAEVKLAKASNVAGGSAIRGRKRGGPVFPGQSYLVGEERPEIFSPGVAGTIRNGAGGSVVNLTVIVQGHALGTKRQLADEVLSALRVAKKQGVNVVVA